jgi:hypothetical protein
MKLLLRLLKVLILATVLSCSQSEKEAGATAYEASVESVNTDNTEVTKQIPVTERKIIKEGEISFQTSNAAETKELLSRSVSELGGYFSSDNVSNYSDRVEYRVTIRIPSDKFDVLLEKISKTAQKIESKNINALDVTEEFIDIEARIKTKKELEIRYKELLKQAKKVEEILEIEREIGSLRSEIESAEGRLNYLKDRVSLSTLTVVFYEKLTSSFGFTSKFGQAIQDGWTNLLWFFIGLANFWPFIVIGLVVIIVYRLKSRKKKADRKLES